MEINVIFLIRKFNDTVKFSLRKVNEHVCLLKLEAIPIPRYFLVFRIYTDGIIKKDPFADADDWEIRKIHIFLDVKIGEGAFGTVYSATMDPKTFSDSMYAKNAGGTIGFVKETSPKVAVKLLRG